MAHGFFIIKIEELLFCDTDAVARDLIARAS